MRLPTNIEELLSGRAVEGDRIEYKTEVLQGQTHRPTTEQQAIEQGTNVIRIWIQKTKTYRQRN